MTPGEAGTETGTVAPLVSVIMPFLNAERFLAEAVDSVLRQTRSDWELLLVDDGSSDGSARIVAHYANRMPDKIRLLRHPGGRNRGTAASRNLAIRNSRGRYVAHLDADDVYEPDRLLRHVEVLVARPDVDVVISRELYWHSWESDRVVGSFRNYDRIRGPYAVANRRIPPPVLFASWLLTPAAVVPSQDSMTYRRAALEAVGLIPDEAGNHYEDQMLYAKLLLSRPCYVLTDCLVRYRQHAGSVTRGNTLDTSRPIEDSGRLSPRFAYLCWLRDYLAQIETGVPELSASVDEEIAGLENPRVGSRRARSLVSRLGLARWAETLLPATLTEQLRKCSEAVNEARVRRRTIRCAEAIERRVLARGRETARKDTGQLL